MKTYGDVVEFHGHSCPGLALGYRVSLRALREFRKRAEDEELVAIVENNSCAVDAVQVMMGCTFGKGNLIFRDFGKQVYTFLMRPSGRGIRISVHWKRPPETKDENALWDRYARGDRSKKIVQFVHDIKAAKVRQILDMDERELMKVTRSKEKLPHDAEIYRSVACDSCREKVAEPRVRIRNGRLLCIPCMEGKG